MERLHGIGIGQGVALGPVALMSSPLPPPTRQPATRPPFEEFSHLKAALSAVAGDLIARASRTEGEAREILEAQAEMAEDPDLLTAAGRWTAQGETAAWSIHTAFAQFADEFQLAGGALAARGSDLRDISARAIAWLAGVPAPVIPHPGHPFVLVARDLAPADTALLDLTQVLGFVTEEGGPTSHTAILAREKGITAVVGVGPTGLKEGDVIVVDAAEGSVVVRPDVTTQVAARARIVARALQVEQAVGATKPSPVPLLANVGSTQSAIEAKALGADGVGLFRTEFLYLDSRTPPTVEDQLGEYTGVLTAFAGSKVVVRVLDCGSDKPLPFLASPPELNPALGLRGIRMLRLNEAVLRTQLEALRQASAACPDTEVSVMAPMVTYSEEAAWFKAICAEYGLTNAGAMIEVPAAAIAAEEILAECDFVSIGTNDLVQYTMAADRWLGSLASYQYAGQTPVLRLIKHVVNAGLRLGKPVSICGEAAADPVLAKRFVEDGVSSLSMAARALADVRRALATFG